MKQQTKKIVANSDLNGRSKSAVTQEALSFNIYTFLTETEEKQELLSNRRRKTSLS